MWDDRVCAASWTGWYGRFSACDPGAAFLVRRWRHASLSLLAACSPAILLGRLQPAASGGEVHDAAYAPGPRHGIDIYLPAKGERPPPILVFFYGGGWKSGDRAMHRFVGRSLAACGALTFIPDYRVWPETGFPGFLRDRGGGGRLRADGKHRVTAATFPDFS